MRGGRPDEEDKALQERNELTDAGSRNKWFLAMKVSGFVMVFGVAVVGGKVFIWAGGSDFKHLQTF